MGEGWKMHYFGTRGAVISPFAFPPAWRAQGKTLHLASDFLLYTHRSNSAIFLSCAQVLCCHFIKKKNGFQLKSLFLVPGLGLKFSQS